MNSKAFIFLTTLLFASVLLISSALATETSIDEEKLASTEGTNDQVYDEKPRCKCRKCCSYPAKSQVSKAETVPEKSEESNRVDDTKYGGYSGGHGGQGGHGGGGGYGGGHGGGGHGGGRGGGGL
ncbi:hypothetical protein FCV25MIE_05010 [Fagus crenata]